MQINLLNSVYKIFTGVVFYCSQKRQKLAHYYRQMHLSSHLQEATKKSGTEHEKVPACFLDYKKAFDFLIELIDITTS